MAGMKEGEVDRERHAHAPDREGAAQGRVAQLRHPQAAAAVRRRRERSAQGDLSAAHRDHGHRGSDGGDQRACARTPSARWSISTCRTGGARRTGICRACSEALQRDFSVTRRSEEWLEQEPELEEQALRERVIARGARAPTSAKVARVGRRDHAPHREARSMLQTLDQHWREHLAAHGLPAPGHPPARLCAEGLPLRIQARGVRAVRRDARARQVRDGLAPVDRSRCAPRRRSSARRPSGASG